MAYLTTLAAFDPYTFGQIFGIGVSFVGFFVYYGKKRSTLLLTKALLDFLYFLQQLMIGAYTGSVLNAIGVVRDIIFYLRKKHKWASSRVWLYLFASLMFLSPVLTWMGPISLFPAVGSVLAVIGFYSLDPHRTRVFGLFAQSLWLIYCLYLKLLSKSGTLRPVAGGKCCRCCRKSKALWHPLRKYGGLGRSLLAGSSPGLLGSDQGRRASGGRIGQKIRLCLQLLIQFLRAAIQRAVERCRLPSEDNEHHSQWELSLKNTSLIDIFPLSMYNICGNHKGGKTPLKRKENCHDL